METRTLLANARDVDSDLMHNRHRFPYIWKLSDLEEVPKNGKTVFSCFSCGGGSSMGYKLAGYTVLGNCEIDPDMEKLYEQNQHPQYTYLMDIRDFNQLHVYPDELKSLDILDGSPPCSVFSTAGDREKAWGKEKVFREGQKEQRLDDLFLHFIRTAEILRPKVVIAENVSGLLKGNAKGYVNELLKAFHSASYVTQIFQMDAQAMGVPQKRQRVFFIAHRDDLDWPKLRLSFNEPPIRFGDVRSERGIPIRGDRLMAELIKKRRIGDRCFADISMRERGKYTMFTNPIVGDERVAPTNVSSATAVRFCDGMKYSDHDYIVTQTFPEDYDFMDQSVTYVCGMSVPPVMMANIASEIYTQWLKPDEDGKKI